MSANETKENPEFNLGAARNKTSLAKTWTRVAAILAFSLFVVGCDRTALPPDHVMMNWSEANLRGMVLSNAPIGMNQDDLEKVLTGSFRRNWRVINCDSTELISHRGFSVPVSTGDYYLMSNFAMVRHGLFASDVITVYFLFGRTHQLKDVSIEKWTDSI